MANGKWASDDAAGDLLAGILNETAEDARAEEERIQAEIQAKEDAERQKLEQLEVQKRQEAQAKISAEEERLSQAAERRTAKMEALRIEELKEKGEWVDPAELARKQAEADEQRRKDEEALARSMAQAERAQMPQAAQEAQLPVPPPKSNTALIGAVVGLVVLVIGVGAALVVISGGAYEVDDQTYAKSVLSPKETEVALVEKGFTPIKKAAPAPAPEEETKTRSKRSSRSSRSSRSKASKPKAKDKTGSKANKKAKELESLLNSSSDPFGAF